MIGQQINMEEEEKERWKENASDTECSLPRSGLQKSSQTCDYAALQVICRDLLMAIGEDPDREGLCETPRRWADWWREFIEYDPGVTETTFASISTDQMICISGMRVFSLCEHHLLPMWCDVSIGYIPTDTVLGLSKFARVAHQFAHRLQIQERLSQQIADEIQRITTSPHVIVVLHGDHVCMSSRGIRTSGVMTSQVTSGRFQKDMHARAEFFSLQRRTHHVSF